jgi:phosphoribosyl-AMP cyclohydrolase
MARLRSAEPDALAVLVTGSYATGRATPLSDLDLTVLTGVPPHLDTYRTWFEPRRAGAALHVSVGTKTLTDWIARAAEPVDPDGWSLGFPTEEAARFLWATDRARTVLGDPPTVRRPGAGPEVEDVVESATKVARARARGDWLGARWHAADLARRLPGLLRPLNPERRVTDRRDALEAALALPTAPPGYRADLLVALGLAPADDGAVAEAGLRLVRGALALLRQLAPDADPQPGLAEALRSGALERLVESG